jgi:hypothetical protein
LGPCSPSEDRVDESLFAALELAGIERLSFGFAGTCSSEYLEQTFSKAKNYSPSKIHQNL